jgi:hypothetical protein
MSELGGVADVVLQFQSKRVQSAIIAWLTADYLDRGGVIRVVRFGVIAAVREPAMTPCARERLESMLKGCEA